MVSCATNKDLVELIGRRNIGKVTLTSQGCFGGRAEDVFDFAWKVRCWSSAGHGATPQLCRLTITSYRGVQLQQWLTWIIGNGVLGVTNNISS